MTQIPLENVSLEGLGYIGLFVAVLINIIKTLLEFLKEKIRPNREVAMNEIVKKIDKLTEKINQNSTTIKEIYDCHLGTTAVTNRGEPRWYIPDLLVENIKTVKSRTEEIKSKLAEIKSVLNQLID